MLRLAAREAEHVQACFFVTLHNLNIVCAILWIGLKDDAHNLTCHYLH
ncbi:MAG: hypothetical protein GY896_20495 [Gammaproteobacteria bacterium]|nr:hypothetical protein [Gammaproteobacteria bacterium]